VSGVWGVGLDSSRQFFTLWDQETYAEGYVVKALESATNKAFKFVMANDTIKVCSVKSLSAEACASEMKKWVSENPISVSKNLISFRGKGSFVSFFSHWGGKEHLFDPSRFIGEGATLIQMSREARS
jgi:hypothetical protein